MTARCVFYLEDSPTGTRATVVLMPSWWDRMFGERMRSVDLERIGNSWRTVSTRRDLAYVTEDSLILNALDFREVGSPARWALGSGAEIVAP